MNPGWLGSLAESMTRPIAINSTWTRRDPSGRVIEFVVVATDAINTYGQRSIRGKTRSGKLIWCAPREMADPTCERFTLVAEVGR